MSLQKIDPQLFQPMSAPVKTFELGQNAPRSFWRDTWVSLKKNRFAYISLWIVGFLIAGAIAAPYLSGYTYYETHLELKNQSPNRAFLFGTDDLGRDLFTRIWFGARISLLIGFCAAMLDFVIGTFWGAAAAYAGEKVDELMMRICDILYAIPYLLKVIIIMVAVGPGIKSIILAMSISGWINMARIIRGQILQLKNMEYVLSAKALGASSWRVLTRHLLPNVAGSIIVTMTLTIPTAIFVEAFLSFLGLGVQAPAASWGSMANDGLSALRYYPWRLFFPAGFICMTMLCFNMIGDGLRDALDPKLR